MKQGRVTTQHFLISPLGLFYRVRYRRKRCRQRLRDVGRSQVPHHLSSGCPRRNLRIRGGGSPWWTSLRNRPQGHRRCKARRLDALTPCCHPLTLGPTITNQHRILLALPHTHINKQFRFSYYLFIYLCSNQFSIAFD